MAKYSESIGCDSRTGQIRCNGNCFFSFTLDHEFTHKKLQKTVKALNLYDNLTPPEGIVAGEGKMPINHTVTHVWYFLTDPIKPWRACNASPNGCRTFMRLRANGTIDHTWCEANGYVHPAVTLDCTVGELEVKDKVTIIDNLGEWMRVDIEGVNAVEVLMLSLKKWKVYGFNAKAKCRRVPEAEQEISDGE